jgi:hypothetical protein
LVAVRRAGRRFIIAPKRMRWQLRFQAGIGIAWDEPMTRSTTQLPRPALTPEALHPFCFVCSGSNPMGLALRYEPKPGGEVAATFIGHSALEGYPGQLHGGVIASLLDGAMTHCLFARGIRAVTGELKVRYLGPVAAGESACVRAWLESAAHGLFQLSAELAVGETVKARASGKFVEPKE